MKNSRFYYWSIMDKKEILELLKQIKYPGFSRDIVSFGMVPDVLIEAGKLTVNLKILSDNRDTIELVAEETQKLLAAKTNFKQIDVVLVETPSTTQPVEPAPKDPFASQQTLQNIKYIIAVASGKGGVGKSTVAANLAATLQKKGYQTGLLDLDIYGPSLPIILGINDRPTVSAAKKLIPLERYGMQVMSFGFISGNQAPAIWRGPMVAKMTEQFFNDVDWGELDFLILDLPPGTGDVQLTLVQKLKFDGAIMVTTPQDIAVADVSKGADMFRKVDVPVLGVVENMSGLQLSGKIVDRSGEPVTDAVLELDDLGTLPVDPDGTFSTRLDLFKHGGGSRESLRLAVPLLGEIPLSQELMAATDAGRPITEQNPDSVITGIYGNIADKIITQLTERG